MGKLVFNLFFFLSFLSSFQIYPPPNKAYNQAKRERERERERKFQVRRFLNEGLIANKLQHLSEMQMFVSDGLLREHVALGRVRMLSYAESIIPDWLISVPSHHARRALQSDTVKKYLSQIPDSSCL